MQWRTEALSVYDYNWFHNLPPWEVVKVMAQYIVYSAT